MRLFALIALNIFIQAANAAPGISLSLGDGADQTTIGVQILILLTVLSVAPAILLMTTSFVRFITVFGMLRTALGLGQLPPTQVLIGLALLLTFMVMQPTFEAINQDALTPYMDRQIDEKMFFQKASGHLRDFMLSQTPEEELVVAARMLKVEKIEKKDDIPFVVLVSSFMLSELKKAFQIGFMLFLPFVIIDMIVASALVSVGLMFLPPNTISLPFKVVLFVLVDGWNLISEGLLRGFIT